MSLRERVWKADEEACMFLGITPDQLKIARALTRPLIGCIRSLIEKQKATIMLHFCNANYAEADHILRVLNIFDEEKADG